MVKLRRRAGSGDIIDRRGARSGGGPGGLPIAVGAGGIGSIIVVIVIALLTLLGGGGAGFEIGSPQFPGAAPQGGSNEVSSPEDEPGMFVEDVLADVQDLWTEIFARSALTYERARLVLFTDATSSGCGPASAATGPFYCPPDRMIYLDLGFFEELHRRFGAPGDFAQAYVIAHEVAHHVQTLTGVSQAAREEGQRSPSKANELSIRVELQADCYAGVWGHSAAQRGLLDPGDLEEALAAAAAIGDDRIQQQSGGRVDQDTWTHGSSEQRQRWFKRGFDSGDPNQCDTFSGGI
jgi:predicted metalloprotease